MLFSGANATRLANLTHLIILSTGIALAQSERGTIAGTVTDPSGAAIPGAKVVVTNKNTNTSNSTVSNEVGNYTVPNLAPGDYNLRVEHQGFKASAITDIVVNATASLRADITMEVGATQQTVEVSATAIALQTR